jgi:hypothetical protein
MRVVSILVALTSLAHADAALPSEGALALPAVALRGPFHSLDEICQSELAESFSRQRHCVVGPKTERAAVVKVLDNFGGARADGYLAIRVGESWFVDQDLPGTKSDGPQLEELHDNLRYTFMVVDVSEGRSGVVLRAIHATWFNTELPFYCVGIEVFCPWSDGRPFCSKPLPVAGRAECHPNARRRPWPGVAVPPRALADWSKWDWDRRVRFLNDGVVEVPPMPRFSLPRALRIPLLADLPAELSAPAAGRYRLQITRP